MGARSAELKTWSSQYIIPPIGSSTCLRVLSKRPSWSKQFPGILVVFCFFQEPDMFSEALPLGLYLGWEIENLITFGGLLEGILYS